MRASMRNVQRANSMGHGARVRQGMNRTHRRGVAVVWVAVLGVLLISLVGLAMDAGVVYLAGTHLQVAADAASLAGAQFVRDPNPLVPRTAAQTIAYENKAMGTPVSLDLNVSNATTGEIVLGRYHRFASPADSNCLTVSCCASPPCFFENSLSPNAVRVRARRITGSTDGQVSLIFGKMPAVNVTGVNVARSATAMTAGGSGAGIITLDPAGDCSLELGGNVIIDLTNAPGYTGDNAVQVNSTDSDALCGNGDFVLRAPETNIVGSPGYDFDGNPTVETYINPDSPTMPDPLAYLPAPPVGLNLGAIAPETDLPTYYPPGYYADGMKISGDKKVLLGPGVYIVEGTSNGSRGGFQTTGGAGVTANNVMIYLKSGKLDLGGGGATTITPMTEEINTDADYIGVAIFQARDNLTEARVIGTSDMNLQGTYYFPRNRLEVGGDGMALGNQLIAWQLYLHGNGLFNIQYDGSFPSPGSKVFLVQ